MGSDTYRFKVGSFECMAVSDGTFTYPDPASFLFSNAPLDRLEDELREYNIKPEQWTQWTSPYICLLIDTGEHRVLVDTGAGGLGPDTGKLLENLRAEGIASGEIDAVVITHGHPDHVGGNTVRAGEPAFPNARFIMWRGEWDFWSSEPELSELRVEEYIKEMIVTVALKNLLPIRDRLDLVDRETDIVPGIRAISAPGHTPGHMALDISSEGEKLLCIADAVIHPIHVKRPDWYSNVDYAPVQVITTRRRLLSMAAAEGSLALVFHFPFPGLGHVVQGREGWQWHPIGTIG